MARKYTREELRERLRRSVYKVVTEASQMATAIQTGDIDVAQYMDTTAIDPFYANGKATIEYYIPDSTAPEDITIEGVDKNGKVCRIVQTINNR